MKEYPATPPSAHVSVSCPSRFEVNGYDIQHKEEKNFPPQITLEFNTVLLLDPLLRWMFGMLTALLFKAKCFYVIKTAFISAIKNDDIGLGNSYFLTQMRWISKSLCFVECLVLWGERLLAAQSS